MKSVFLLICFHSMILAEVLTFGIVPRYNLNQIRDQWQPLIDKVAQRNGIEIELKTQEGVSQFLQAYKQGKYDLVYSNPGHYIIAHDLHGYEAILRSKQDVQGVIVTSSKNTSVEVSDFENLSFTLPSPSAFAATVMTRVEIYDQYGFDILKRPPLYVNTLQNAMLKARLNPEVAAGTAVDVLQRASESFKSDLRVLFTTSKLPSHPIAIHPRISTEQKEKIIQAFISLKPEFLQGLAMENIIKTHNKEFDRVREVLKKNEALNQELESVLP